MTPFLEKQAQNEQTIFRMHRAYQPLTPANNIYLRQRWDQEFYEEHRKKISLGGYISWKQICKMNIHVVKSCHATCISIRFYSYCHCLLSIMVSNRSLYFRDKTKTVKVFWFFFSTAKSVIDNKPPKTYMHLHIKLKKLQVSSESSPSNFLVYHSAFTW